MLQGLGEVRIEADHHPTRHPGTGLSRDQETRSLHPERLRGIADHCDRDSLPPVTCRRLSSPTQRGAARPDRWALGQPARMRCAIALGNSRWRKCSTPTTTCSLRRSDLPGVVVSPRHDALVVRRWLITHYMSLVPAPPWHPRCLRAPAGSVDSHRGSARNPPRSRSWRVAGRRGSLAPTCRPRRLPRAILGTVWCG